jgi:hypothetical protein
MDDQEIQDIFITTRLIMLSSYNYNHFPRALIASFASPLFHFIIFRMSYKCNHIVYNLLGLAFSTLPFSLEILPGYCMWQ